MYDLLGMTIRLAKTRHFLNEHYRDGWVLSSEEFRCLESFYHWVKGQLLVDLINQNRTQRYPTNIGTGGVPFGFKFFPLEIHQRDSYLEDTEKNVLPSMILPILTEFAENDALVRHDTEKFREKVLIPPMTPCIWQPGNGDTVVDITDHWLLFDGGTCYLADDRKNIYTDVNGQPIAFFKARWESVNHEIFAADFIDNPHDTIIEDIWIMNLVIQSWKQKNYNHFTPGVLAALENIRRNPWRTPSMSGPECVEICNIIQEGLNQELPLMSYMDFVVERLKKVRS